MAAWPAIRDPGDDMPRGGILGILGALLASGLLWVVLAASLALRGEPLSALREE